MDASAAILECVGQIDFAMTIWKLLPTHDATLIISLGLAVWLVLALCLLGVRRKRVFRNF